jgi:hypothetical protein
MTIVASLALVGFAAIVSAAALSAAAQPDRRADGREMMVEAQYQLAMALKR